MFSWGKRGKNSSKEQFDKYDILLKCEKRNLHSRYIACISVAICIWLIVTDTSGNAEFVGQLSLAGTIASIILSVIAIIMSITGEGKTEAIRNQMLETTQELKHTVTSVEQIDEDVKKSIEKLKESIEVLQEKVDRVPDATAERFTKVEKQNNNYIQKRKNNNPGNWIKKEGEINEYKN